MQHLHLVGFTAGLDGLIFSAKRGSKSGGFVVSLDDHLLDSIREAVRLQTGAESGAEADDDDPMAGRIDVPDLRRLGRVHSELSPKEIQARLRAGRTIAEVADEAEVDESWILRFASPIIAEQSQIIERALHVRCRANRKGESAETLAESVRSNLVERGTVLTDDEISAAWSAYHLRDASWVVRFRYVSRRRAQIAQWLFDLGQSTIVSQNRLATELGYVDPSRRKRRGSSPDAIGREERRPPARDPLPERQVARRRTAGTTGGAPRRVGASVEASPAPGTKKVRGRTGAEKGPRSTETRSRPAVTNAVAKKRAAWMKTAAPRRSAPVGTAAEKVAVDKAQTNKPSTKKAPAKKVTAKKVTAKKVTAKKVTAKKVGVNKPPAEKAATAKDPTTKAGTSPGPGSTGGVRLGLPVRRSAVAQVVIDPGAARRNRPLVAVRAERPVPPLSDRVVRASVKAGEHGSTNGSSVAPQSIQADRAGQAAPSQS